MVTQDKCDHEMCSRNCKDKSKAPQGLGAHLCNGVKLIDVAYTGFVTHFKACCPPLLPPTHFGNSLSFYNLQMGRFTVLSSDCVRGR